jgi:hypothetical protein
MSSRLVMLTSVVTSALLGLLLFSVLNGLARLCSVSSRYSGPVGLLWSTAAPLWNGCCWAREPVNPPRALNASIPPFNPTVQRVPLADRIAFSCTQRQW